MIRTRLVVGLAALFLAAAAQPPAIGKPAPAFSGVDETGAKHTLADYKGKAVVLEWTNPDCPFVARHYEADTMEKLAAALGAKEVVWLAVNSTWTNTADATKEWKSEQGFTYATLQDNDGTIGHAYGAKTTPSARTRPGNVAVPTACVKKVSPRRTIHVPSRPAPTASSSTSATPRWKNGSCSASSTAPAA